ncbi:zinc finger protein 888 isoform X2 [Plutella xylostella]|uniref:zinc finger protein 888 isoform X2 n=1 Tax=Plutella xylostella TaxID=51655 RepID=UPI0020326681|nr:zinc finger protein 888 isoform X2 [Plutella xylostella]
MVDLKACRVCLATDVKIHSLRGYPLEAYFEAIVGMNPLYFADLPLYACYECAALIKKYNIFREKCLKGQTVLYTILQKHGQITLDNIKELDREKLNLSSNYNQFLLFKDELLVQGTDLESETHVKQETANENLELLENFLPLTEPHNLEFDVDVDVQVKLLKTEDDYADLPSLGPDSTDDDEPLATHKSLKEKSVKKDKKKKVKKDGKKKKKEPITKLEELDLSQEIFDEINGEVELPILPTEALEPEVKKAKRGRPRKTEAKTVEPKAKTRRTTNTGGVAADEADLEEYVNVIKLSVEEQIAEITSRQQSSNYLNAPFQCSLCYKGFIDTHAWKHHVGKHGPSAGDVECPICKFRFKTKRALQKHAANHEKKYACKSCPYVSKTTTQAKQHHRWHKGVTYKCQYCDEVSTKWTSYLSHVRIKHPSEFICGVCGYSFVSKLGLTMHKSMMHKDVIAQEEAQGADTGGPYCELCSVQFTSAQAWKRHMVTSVKHTQATHFNNGCRVCGESFKSPEELRIHHRKEHARKRPKNYGKKPPIMTWPSKCEHCEEEIPNAREYWTHFRRAHPDRQYPIQKSYICEICGKSFRGNAFLVYHKRTHFEERAYKCAQCPKAFFNRTNLQMHEKTHSDRRPYPCTVCFKAFKCKGALDRHFRQPADAREDAQRPPPAPVHRVLQGVQV